MIDNVKFKSNSLHNEKTSNTLTASIEKRGRGQVLV